MSDTELCGFAWKEGTEPDPDKPGLNRFKRVTCVLPLGHTGYHVPRDSEAPLIAPMGTPLERDWYSNHENIVAVTAWMADQGHGASEVARAVEKPWDYADEFVLARQDLACWY